MDPNNEKSVDSLQDVAFINALKTLPEKLATTIRFFERNDYWTLHGSDALYVASEIFKSSSRIKIFKQGSISLEYIVVNKGNFELVLKELLLIKHYKVEVYKLKNAKTQDWQLTYKASPGNLFQFEDILFNENLNNSIFNSCLIALKITKEHEQMCLGIAVCDSLAREFQVVQFVDGGQFLTLESILVQIRPKECLVAIGDVDSVRNILVRNNVAITECKKADFDSKNINQDLNRLLKPINGQTTINSDILPEMDFPVALSCLAAIIKYLELLSDETEFSSYTMSTLKLGQFMRLDSSACAALDLIPLTTNGPSCSLYNTLNRCRTTGGQRTLANWILQPLTDKNLIEDRLDIVTALIENADTRCILHEDKLRRIPDLLLLSRKLISKRAKLQDCYRVYTVVQNLPALQKVLEKGGDKVADMFASPIKELLVDFEKYQEMIESTMDLTQVDSHEFLIKPDFDDDLKVLKAKINSLETDCQKELVKVSKDLGLESNKILKLESNSQLGYFFRVTRKEEKALRGSRNYDILDANKSGIRFRSTNLSRLSSDYSKMLQMYEEQQKAVVKEIISIASGYGEPLLILSDLIGRLDVLVSLAVVATDAPTPYVRPKILPMGSGILKLKQMRHACLERQNTVSFIPNDIIMDEKQNFYIITGPNMGGKSTYIKSVGITTLMCQIGSFVPCEEAEISIVDCMMTRVGASDSQAKGVSTFMMEMLSTSTILNASTSNSLIIIDELGRGTSTYDGFGLAWAIAKKIATDIKGFCLFATHFHELTSLADEVVTIGNRHVTALTTGDSLTLLYKVEEGVCDQSFGIHVAEMVQFPRRVIENAKMRAIELEHLNQPIRLSEDGLNRPIRSPENNLNDSNIPKVTLEEAKSFILKVKEIEREYAAEPKRIWVELQSLKMGLGQTRL